MSTPHQNRLEDTQNENRKNAPFANSTTRKSEQFLIDTNLSSIGCLQWRKQKNSLAFPWPENNFTVHDKTDQMKSGHAIFALVCSLVSFEENNFYWR